MLANSVGNKSCYTAKDTLVHRHTLAERQAQRQAGRQAGPRHTHLDKDSPFLSIQAMLVASKLLHCILQTLRRLHNSIAFAIIGKAARLEHKRVSKLISCMLCLLCI